MNGYVCRPSRKINGTSEAENAREAKGLRVGEQIPVVVLSLECPRVHQEETSVASRRKWFRKTDQCVWFRWYWTKRMSFEWRGLKRFSLDFNKNQYIQTSLTKSKNVIMFLICYSNVFHDYSKQKIEKSLIFRFIFTRRNDVFLLIAIIYLLENGVVLQKSIKQSGEYDLQHVRNILWIFRLSFRSAFSLFVSYVSRNQAKEFLEYPYIFNLFIDTYWWFLFS